MPGFNGLRVLSFESRRAEEIAQLIRNNGGEPIVAPSTREVETPNEEERKLIAGIVDGKFDSIIFMTGVGARSMVQTAESMNSREDFISALRRTRIVVRGPKPAATMRDFNIPVTLPIPEPNTWRERIKALDDNPEKIPLKNQRIAIQEHGEPSLELYAALRERGAEVFPVQVYRWALPEDTAPLKHAIRALINGEVDVVLFTSRIQYLHAAQIASEMELKEKFATALNKTMVASIGPVATEALREHGVRVDFEPSHPKMGFLVKEAAEKSADVVQQKSKPHLC